MDIAFLFPFILLIGVMFLMTRSAKNRQRQAMEMRDAMEPGTGVRTIGGMYAQVKEVRDDTVLLEINPGVHALFAKNAIGAVLDADEYERIVNGETEDEETPVVPDDASSLIESDDDAGDDRVELGKDEAKDDARAEAKAEESRKDDGESGSRSDS
ncbi:MULTISPECIES: preprotein translocase subunit YajC [unclassified Streptomyces]|uniref:Preprotein translocase subunit YajC n=1 Tax=Streptomyces millisiae TaxID=3075542 RepID=A0ABU2LSY2_9ACTN|nr:preprotein translocase subunit YajC [Streptomyces sp. DSM 44918]MDT0320700.1 preprotein translocase subunit YajC [Streptomyces sp. DSM 44918]